MKKVYLNNNWVLTNDKVGSVAATVPGCVHTDLINDGQIKDLFWRDNKLKYDWIENEDFTYTCTFDAEQSDNAVLVFEGLDTYCDIFLNGELLGKCDDMHTPYDFNIGGKLKEKDNVLEVKFRSPIKEVEGLPLCNGAFTRERMRTRRMQCTYGWDWVERFVTCGIYRPVYIKYGNDIHVDSAYIVTESIDEYSAQIKVTLEVENCNQGGLLQIDIVAPNGDTVCSTEVYCKEPKVVRNFDIVNPELWYPLGYGEHPIYTLCVTVNDNLFTETFGIRTVKILQLKDKVGSDYYNRAKKYQAFKLFKNNDFNEEFSGFLVLVNGKKILCRGGNWVPSEPFPSAETKEKFEKLITLATKMDVNMLRVWGGAIFEDKYFYDLCDRAGILVTQDFLMACGTYPEKEQWFIDALKREAMFAVKHLRNHPCLAWWNGDNENAVNGNDTMEDYTGRDSALAGIAPTLYEYDYSRQFLPSSPYGGKNYSSVTAGTTHTTNFVGDMYDYFDETDCTDYKEFLNNFTARFITEEPTFGAISRKSALRFLNEQDIADPDENMLRFHTKGADFLKKELYDYVATFALKALGEATDTDDRYFKYKYIQYEWVRVVYENARRNIGYNNGLVFWMFNDQWPASTGWAFVDYYCMPKASFYIFKRLAQNTVVSVIKEQDGYKAVISNDLEQSVKVSGHAYLLKISEGMKVCDEYGFSTTVGDYNAESVALPFETDPDHVVVCDIEVADKTDRSFYKDGNLPIYNCSDALKIVSRNDNSITVTTDSYIHAVEFEGDFLFSDDYFSLMPGEEKTVTFESLSDEKDNDFTVAAYTIK